MSHGFYEGTDSGEPTARSGRSSRDYISSTPGFRKYCRQTDKMSGSVTGGGGTGTVKGTLTRTCTCDDWRLHTNFELGGVGGLGGPVPGSGDASFDIPITGEQGDSSPCGESCRCETPTSCRLKGSGGRVGSKVRVDVNEPITWVEGETAHGTDNLLVAVWDALDTVASKLPCCVCE